MSAPQSGPVAGAKTLTQLWAHPLGEVFVSGGTGGRQLLLFFVNDGIGSSTEALSRVTAAVAKLSARACPFVYGVLSARRIRDGRLVLAGDLVEGAALSTALADGALPVERVLAIGRQICHGLDAIHDVGLVHGMLSPASVLLTRRDDREDAVQLTDFVLAKEVSIRELGARNAKSQPLSPELVAGDELTPHTDIYLAGAVLYAMLAGRSPFGGGPGEVRDGHANKAPQPLDAAPELTAIVERCLAKDPGDRFRDARELDNALGDAQVAIGAKTKWDDLPRLGSEEAVRSSKATAPQPTSSSARPEIPSGPYEVVASKSGGSANQPTAVARKKMGLEFANAAPEPPRRGGIGSAALKDRARTTKSKLPSGRHSALGNVLNKPESKTDSKTARVPPPPTISKPYPKDSFETLESSELIIDDTAAVARPRPPAIPPAPKPGAAKPKVSAGSHAAPAAKQRAAASAKDGARAMADAQTARGAAAALDAGADQVLVARDLGRIAERAVAGLDAALLVDGPGTGSALDTRRAADQFRELDCRPVVVLGGDGTCRDVAMGWPEVTMIPLSTGTNNVFPRFIDGSSAGTAAGLIASGAIAVADVGRPAKVLRVCIERHDHETEHDLALVDVALTDDRRTGARAVVRPESIRAVVATIATPQSTGLSSIAGRVHPLGRHEPGAVSVTLGGERRVRVPIMPGSFDIISIDRVEHLSPGETVRLAGPGALAYDGERDRVLPDDATAVVSVDPDGPMIVDVERTLLCAANQHLYDVPPTPKAHHGD